MKSLPHQSFSKRVREAFTSGALFRFSDKSIKQLGSQPYRVIGLSLILLLTSCATRPHVYAPPNSGKLKASTQRVSVAVDRAHNHAREAKTKVEEAAQIAKEVQTETAKIKDVPDSVVAGFANLESKLNETRNSQTLLEQDLVEADKAKAEAKKDQDAFLASTQKVIDDANKREAKHFADEKKYHSLKLWLALAVASVVGFIVWQFKLLFLPLGPYGWAAMAALPIGAFGLVWLIT